MKDRKKLNGVPKQVQLDGNFAKSPRESANLFANFFEKAMGTCSPPIDHEYLNSLPGYEIFMPMMNFSENEVYMKLRSIDSSKRAGPDDIPPSLLKNCAISLALPISMLFNRSLNEGTFPSLWKSACVTPIHKSGNLQNVENFRGISILSCIPKLMESLMHERIYQSVQHVLSPDQHGFVKKRSTLSNLMCYASTLINKIEKRQQVDAVYIDFTKAFDRVPHELLVEKLKKMGLPTWLTKWIRSYLVNRTAYVKIGTVVSETFQISSGVPQGSHLGPLLFVLFINDLCSLIHSSKLLYADDLKIFRTITCPLDCYVLQKDIDTLLKWCNTNGMQANAGKCNTVSFTRARNPILFDYRMDQTTLQRKSEIKDLGVVFDCKLKFTTHIGAITAKAFATLGLIRRNTKDFTNIYCLKTLFNSLVRTVLEYCVQVWAPYHDVHANRIERVQKSFLRYALRTLRWNDPVNLPPYEQRCRLIGLPTLAERRILLQRLFIYDLLMSNIDSRELLEKLQISAPSRTLRHYYFLRLPTHRTQYGLNNPLENSCRHFNNVYHLFDFNLSKCSFRLRIS